MMPMEITYDSRIEGLIKADTIEIGRGVRVEEGVVITGKHGPANLVVLGDFCYIGRHTRIMAPEFRLGDYSKLHAFSFAHGEKPLQIGRNCWIGGTVVLDSMGGLDLEDNVCVGAHSHVWTHMQFGDIVEGCRFFSRKYLYIGRDVWFGGHCTVTPVQVGEKSMALAGSVVTKDMLPNHVYAGVPATDVTSKMGYQFESLAVAEKASRLQKIIDEFVIRNPEFAGRLLVIQSPDEKVQGVTCFDVSRRTYTRTYSQAEVGLLKEYTPLIKFTPEGTPPFIVPQEKVTPMENAGGRQ